jgi:hypothetical protein
MTAWTRAVLLGRSSIGKQLASLLEKIVPEIIREDLKTYAKAKGDEEERFAATFILLRNPALTPVVRSGLPREAPANEVGGSSNENWWCKGLMPRRAVKAGTHLDAEREEVDIENSPLRLLYTDGRVPHPRFISVEELRKAAREWQALFEADDAPVFMTKEVLSWARKHPDDPRVPEALHLAVRSTRFGCAGTDASALSREAYQALHGKYPKSPWAAKTKYWY